MVLELLILSILLFVLEFTFIKVSQYFKIIDLPNERSSHQIPTIRGGGIVFVIATLFYFIQYNFQFPYLVLAVCIVGTISFWDDVKSLSNKVRFTFHLIAMLLVFYQLDLFHVLSPVYTCIALVLFIGILNAYNFMDGINSITALYSLSILIPFALTETDYSLKMLEIYIVISVIVFSFFNIRKVAKVFAGDIGSIAMSILIVFLIISRMKETGNYTLIGVLLVYGVDTIFTLMHRIYKKENIFKAHRQHLYQFLTNEDKHAHIKIGMFYSIIQFGLNVLLLNQQVSLIVFIGLVFLFSLLYWKLKWKYI